MLVAAVPVQTCEAVMVGLRLLRLVEILLSAYASACQSRQGLHVNILYGWL